MTKSLDTNWQCIVIGAGPCGSIASLKMAERGIKVLLIEKAEFPRSKVCGCCINASAQQALVEGGLPDLLKTNHAVSLEDLILFDKKRSSSVKLPTAWSLSRERLDYLLVQKAIASGATFLPGCFAQVLNSTNDELETQVKIEVEGLGNRLVLSASIVIIADGLSGRSLQRLDDFTPKVDRSSRFGAGVILSEGPEFYSPGHIYMACTDGGYVGLVRLEDGRLDVAAAFDHSYSRLFQGPAQAAIQVLDECGLTIPSTMQEAPWSGTQLLTRRRSQVGGPRLLIAGDASGYPEPFTGEGIAWALWSGLWAGTLASEGVNDWNSEILQRWQRQQAILRKQQTRSSAIAKILRNSMLRRTMMTTFEFFPRLTSQVVRKVSESNLTGNGAIK